MQQIQAHTADPEAVSQWLSRAIAGHADEKGTTWLKSQIEKLKGSYSERGFFMAFGASSRFFVEKPLNLSEDDLQHAADLRPGFAPANWNLRQTVRSYLLFFLPAHDAEVYLGTLNKLFETADVAEQVAMYAALPLLPHPQKLVKRAAEGVRTNMTVVLDAISLNNPYPAEYLDEVAWNQLVLKNIFTERPLYKIQHLDTRANADLAQMLTDFAHERRAAGRYIVPELWRPAAPFLTEKDRADIEWLFEKGTETEKMAASLVCQHCPAEAIKQLSAKYPDARQLQAAKAPDWDALGRLYHQRHGLSGTAYQQAGSGESPSSSSEA